MLIHSYEDYLAMFVPTLVLFGWMRGAYREGGDSYQTEFPSVWETPNRFNLASQHRFRSFFIRKRGKDKPNSAGSMRDWLLEWLNRERGERGWGSGMGGVQEEGGCSAKFPLWWYRYRPPSSCLLPTESGMDPGLPLSICYLRFWFRGWGDATSAFVRRVLCVAYPPSPACMCTHTLASHETRRDWRNLSWRVRLWYCLW